MAGSVFSKIAERVYAKNLAARLENAIDSTSVVIPDTKSGNLIAANYVLKGLNIPTRWEDGQPAKGDIAWGYAQSNAQNISLTPKNNDSEYVPNVIGMGAKDAVYLLEERGLKVTFSGIGKVSSQSIPHGSRIKKGQTIKLQLKH